MDKLTLFYPWQKDKTFITQKFGTNPIPVYKEMGMLGHNGWDISMLEGTPIYAAHDGIVVYTGIEAKEGMGIVMRTNETYDYNGQLTFFKSIYWHNRYPDGIKVKVGDKIKAGDIIALADTTGLATGSHLHFGLKPVYQGENEWTWGNLEQNNGYFGAIDPMPYWNGMYAQDIQKIISIQRMLVATLETLIALLKRSK